MIPMRSRSHVTRRTFLRVSCAASGGLLIGSYLAACAPAAPAPDPTPAPLPTDAPAPPADVSALPTDAPTLPPTAEPLPEGPFQPNLFLRIDPDGAVTLTVHRSEMGQGVRTALAMILAEELDADWASVRVEQSPANAAIGNQITSGSGSVLLHYASLRQAGATARQLLVAAAARTWGVPPEECRTEPGAVVYTATGARLGYGALAGAAGRMEPASTPAKLKDPQEFRLIGTSVPRVDEPAIVTGQAIYGLDVRLPGMLFATVARCPVPGGTLVDYDAAEAEATPGVRAVVSVPSGVAVVAEHTWAAIRGRAALKITWDEGARAALSSEALRARLAEMMDAAVARETSEAATTIEAVYETPYLAHAPMEPVNCVADVREDRCEIWAPTQNPQAVQEYVRDSVGVPTDVHVTLLGGGFGRRLEVDFAVEAARVSKGASAPVQVVWTREDDIQHDFYRQQTYHWLRAGWDAEGNLASWRHFIAAPGINGVAYHAGNEVLEEGLAVPYTIPDKRSRTLLANIPIPTGPWRAVMSGPSAFANECFLDEVAAALQKDPYELRMALLPESDRLRPILELAAAQAGWGAPLPAGHGRGIACHTYRQTAVAMVAEASVQDGQVRVHKVVCAVNCGTVVHPDMVVQQMEGSIADGLASLLKGEITFERGRVQQSNFGDYPLLRIDEMPQVEVHILPDPRPPQGVGETGVPPIVPAVANAIFAATGARIRRIPIRAGDLRAG
jgi:isoquinoline 1-oxidoreductase beta subunit